MSTAVLLIVLALLYPHVWGLFASLIVLDIVSHWFQMYCKLAQAISTHKGSKNPLLNFYYTFPYALLVFCVGNEAFFIALYIISFNNIGSTMIWICYTVLYITGPICFGKQFMNVVQLMDACGEIVEMDCPTTPASQTVHAAPTH